MISINNNQSYGRDEVLLEEWWNAIRSFVIVEKRKMLEGSPFFFFFWRDHLLRKLCASNIRTAKANDFKNSEWIINGYGKQKMLEIFFHKVACNWLVPSFRFPPYYRISYTTGFLLQKDIFPLTLDSNWKWI